MTAPYYRIFRTIYAAKNRITEVLGGVYYTAPKAANDLSDLLGLTIKLMEVMERIALDNRNAYARKYPHGHRPPVEIDRMAFRAFYISLMRSLGDPLMKNVPKQPGETP